METYGVTYEYIATTEGVNGTSHSYGVTEEKLDSHDLDKIARYSQGKSMGCCDINILLTDMCNRKLISPGEYVVTISW